MHHSKSNLIREYGLTEYAYDALTACVAPTYWKQGDLTHSITILYQLRDRGLLSGPPTGKPNSQPFHLTNQGREILARIERGQHKREWLAASRVRLKAMEILAAGSQHIPYLNFRAVRLPTLRALENAGYVSNAGTEWSLTPLGREAWQEWNNLKSKI